MAFRTRVSAKCMPQAVGASSCTRTGTSVRVGFHVCRACLLSTTREARACVHRQPPWHLPAGSGLAVHQVDDRPRRRSSKPDSSSSEPKAIATSPCSPRRVRRLMRTSTDAVSQSASSSSMRNKSRDLPGAARSKGAWRPGEAMRVTSFFGFAHRQLLGHDLGGGGDLVGTLQGQQGPAHAPCPGHRPSTSVCTRVGQTAADATGCSQRCVSGPTACAACSCREAELFGQSLEALRFFERVEVLALHVLDQRHRGRPASSGTSFTSTGTSLRPARRAARKRRSTRDDFVAALGAVAHRAHEDGLHHALALDAFGQLVEASPRPCGCAAGTCRPCRRSSIRRVGGASTPAVGFVLGLGAEQGFQTEAEALGFFS